jgi:hypothetical protein
MYGLTRGVLTGIAAGVAGFLIFIASAWVDGGSTGAYWARMGLFVAAGFVMALSQLLGGWTKGGFPKISANVFLFGFVPVLVTAGWVMLFSQPPNTVQQHISTWSQNIGIRDVVQNLREYVGILAFGLGLVFGFTFDTSGPRRRTAVVERDREVAREPVARPEDEPTLRDRRDTTDAPRVAGRGFLGRRRNAEPPPVASDGTAADGRPVDETTVGPTTRR